MRRPTILAAFLLIALVAGCDAGGGFGLDGSEWPDLNPCGDEGCPTLRVKGKVLESEGLPVALAIVRLDARFLADTTDASGSYTLEWKSTISGCQSWFLIAEHPDGETQSDSVRVCYSAEHDFNF